MRSQFSEETFGFCFNYELVSTVRTNGFLVVPILPSTREEKELAYDIEVQISRGSFGQSLFLQHKVPRFVRNRLWNNSLMYDCHNAPFYWFNVRNSPKSKQHNRLVALAQLTHSVYYCAPLFHRMWDMQYFFINHTVTEKSRLFNPVDMGRIGQLEHHQVSYDLSGTVGYFHTESSKIPVLKLSDILEEVEAEIGKKYYSDLLKTVIGVLEKTGTKKVIIPKNLEEFGDVIKTSYLLKRNFNLTWILL